MDGLRGSVAPRTVLLFLVLLGLADGQFFPGKGSCSCGDSSVLELSMECFNEFGSSREAFYGRKSRRPHWSECSVKKVQQQQRCVLLVVTVTDLFTPVLPLRAGPCLLREEHHGSKSGHKSLFYRLGSGRLLIMEVEHGSELKQHMWLSFPGLWAAVEVPLRLWIFSAQSWGSVNAACPVDLLTFGCTCAACRSGAGVELETKEAGFLCKTCLGFSYQSWWLFWNYWNQTALSLVLKYSNPFKKRGRNISSKLILFI